MGYSIQFRREVFRVKKEKKLTVKATAELFGIDITTIFRWQKRIEPCKTRNKPPSKIYTKVLEKDIELYPDAYNRERAKRLNVSNTGIFWALKRLNISYKKNSKTSESG
jgi:transposase